MKPIYKIMFSISVVLMLASLAVFLIYGLNLGIDFTGGALMEVEFRDRQPEVGDLLQLFSISNLGGVSVSATGDRGVLIKMPEISEEKHQEILNKLNELGEFEEKRFDSIGSVLGAELKRKSIAAIIIALLAISLYLAVVFRRIGQVINPFVLALGAVGALLHDLLLPLGVFVLLGKFQGVALDAPLIAAALAILGYSINDTVVVYDRIRENILRDTNNANNFNQIVHKSIKQTLSRSINTTLTTLFAVIAIYIFGGATLKNFSLALIIGIASGAYSSIFIASPVLMILHRK